MRHKNSFFCIMLSLFFMLSTLDIVVAQQAEAVRNTTLENGLEVFVVENHAVPLVTVCIAFRGGAMAHTPKTAGLSICMNI